MGTHLCVVVHVALKDDGWLSSCLSGVNDVQIVEVLYLAQATSVNAFLTGHQQLKSVLLLCMNDQTYDRDSKEQNLKWASEHGTCEHLSEQKYQVGPGKDGWQQLTQELRSLVVVGAVHCIGEEASGGGCHKDQWLEQGVLRLREKGEEED